MSACLIKELSGDSLISSNFFFDFFFKLNSFNLLAWTSEILPSYFFGLPGSLTLIWLQLFSRRSLISASNSSFLVHEFRALNSGIFISAFRKISISCPFLVLRTKIVFSRSSCDSVELNGFYYWILIFWELTYLKPLCYILLITLCSFFEFPR